MIDTPLFRFTRLCIAVVGSAAIAAAMLHQAPAALREAPVGVTATGPIVPTPILTAPIVPVSAAPVPTSTTTTTTTTSTTTSTPAPTAPVPAAVAAPTLSPRTTTPATTTTAPRPAPAVAAQHTSACASQLFQLMNDTRSAAGIAPVAYDDTILPVPRDWASHLGRTRDLAHNPDYGSQIFSRQPQAMRAAENVGTSTSVRSMHERFMSSTTHRANILDPDLGHAAVGCVADSSGQLWATVNFWGA